MATQRANPRRSAVSRRHILKAAAAGSVAAAGLGWLGGKAPAVAQQRSLHFLLNNSFRPPVNTAVQALAKDYEQMTGVVVKTEFIHNNDLLPRNVAAVENGIGADLFVTYWNHCHLFDKRLVDVGDLVAAIGGDRIYSDCRGAVQVNGVYRGVPWYLLPSAMTYNKTLCDKLGITTYPDTYDQLLIAGKKMKDAGTPVGWCLGHTIGDGSFGNYPIFWAFGAYEVDEKGKVVLNSKEGRQAVEWMRQFWHDACDEGGMGWDDASNNQAFLAQAVACVLNATSIYLKARADKNPLADQMRHTIAPAGPAGRFHLNLPFSVAIPAYSKNRAVAKEFLRYFTAKPQYERVFLASAGFGQGVTPEWEDHPFWKTDPILTPFAHLTQYGRHVGYRGTYNRASAEVQSKYIIADTFARGIREGSESALTWAEHELKLIYEHSA